MIHDCKGLRLHAICVHYKAFLATMFVDCCPLTIRILLTTKFIVTQYYSACCMLLLSATKLNSVTPPLLLIALRQFDLGHSLKREDLPSLLW